jgi:hypothetical protein
MQGNSSLETEGVNEKNTHKQEISLPHQIIDEETPQSPVKPNRQDSPLGSYRHWGYPGIL